VAVAWAVWKIFSQCLLVCKVVAVVAVDQLKVVEAHVVAVVSPAFNKQAEVVAALHLISKCDPCIAPACKLIF
jgi:2-C-methyl-D-erythritol 4-phosphate cytidylyltransferase